MEATDVHLKATNCPACRFAESYGPRRPFGQFWMSRCRKCGYYGHEPMPSIRKTIIGLDQFVAGNIVAANDVRWANIYQRLRLLVSLQIVSCPHSEVHRDESLLATSSREALRGVFRELAGEDEFPKMIDIEERQLLDRMSAYLDGNLPSDDLKSWRSFDLKSWRSFDVPSPHRWTLGPSVFADFPLRPETVTRLQDDKKQLHDAMTKVSEYWRADPVRFEEDIKREGLAYGRTSLEVYRDLAGRRKQLEALITANMPEMKQAFADAYEPEGFDPRTPPGWAPAARIVHWLAAAAYRHDPSADPIATVEAFFASQYALGAPFLDISSHLYAALAQGSRNPKGARVPKPSDSFDIAAISHFAPYCDAILVDNFFYGVATQGNVDLPGRYGVKLFCPRTLDAFAAYLDQLLFSIPEDHRRILREIYPHLAQLTILQAA